MRAKRRVTGDAHDGAPHGRMEVAETVAATGHVLDMGHPRRPALDVRRQGLRDVAAGGRQSARTSASSMASDAPSAMFGAVA